MGRFSFFDRIACAALLGTIFVATSGAVLAESDDARTCARSAREGDIQACVRAIARDPSDIESRRNLALAYLSVNSYEECDRTHREIIALTPDDPQAYYDHAAALATFFEFKRPAEPIRIALRLAPDDPRAHYDHAAALATFFEFKRAVEPIRVALRLAPDDLAIVRLAATIFEQAHEYRAAFAAMLIGAEHGEMLLMFDVAVYYQRGLGTPADPEAARSWFERAATAGHVGAMETLARIYAEGRDGTPRDPARAQFWSERAKADGIAPNEPERTTY